MKTRWLLKKNQLGERTKMMRNKVTADDEREDESTTLEYLPRNEYKRMFLFQSHQLWQDVVRKVS